jgi:hypothetical protein
MRSAAVQAHLRAQVLRRTSCVASSQCRRSLSSSLSTSVLRTVTPVAPVSSRPSLLRSFHSPSLLLADPPASKDDDADADEADDDPDSDVVELTEAEVAGTEEPAEANAKSPFTRSERRRMALKIEDESELGMDDIEEGDPDYTERDLDDIPDFGELTEEAQKAHDEIDRLEEAEDEADEVDEAEKEEDAEDAARLAALRAKVAAKNAAASKPTIGRRTKKVEDPLTSFFASIKMTDHADKFSDSIEEVIRMKTRDLKEMGLSVKQRKTFLKLVDRYKAQMRANSALALIRANGSHTSPAELQKQVYEIMYAHIYEANAVREKNVVITADWRAPREEYKEKRKQEHNNLRGLREPEIMEMAKIEAKQIMAAREFIREQVVAEEERKKRMDEEMNRKGRRDSMRARSERRQRRNSTERHREQPFAAFSASA